MNEPIISVRNLTKRYHLYAKPSDRIKESLWPFKRRHTQFSALSDISFDVYRGEQLGVLGVNGAGKSTLLQIITGVLTPTTGSVTVRGRVAALLELGAGFNSELTGRENSLFQMQLTGMTKDKINSKIKEIENFADVGDFFDQPMKLYSSGMYARVAFASSALCEPEILIVDEALAVGDVRFQKKCMDHMLQMKANGVTILLISHDVFGIKSSSDRLLLLDKGRVLADGDPETVTTKYFKILYPETPNTVSEQPTLLTQSADDTKKIAFQAAPDKYVYTINPSNKDTVWGGGGAILKEVRIKDLLAPNRLLASQKLEIECDYVLDSDILMRLVAEHGLIPNILLGMRFDNARGFPLTDFATALCGNGILDIDIEKQKSFTMRFTVSLPLLAEGNYFVSPSMALGVQHNLLPIFCYENLVQLTYEPDTMVLGAFRVPMKIERIA